MGGHSSIRFRPSAHTLYQAYRHSRNNRGSALPNLSDERCETDAMDETEKPGLQGWTPGLGGPPQGGGYPGVGDPLFGPPAYYNPPVQVLPAAQPATTAAKGGGLSSLVNLNEIKGIIDRVGGLDGILANMGKIQKLMAMMQQMAPLVRLLIGKGKAGTASADKSSGAAPRPRRRTGANRGLSGSRAGRSSPRRPAAKKRR